MDAVPVESKRDVDEVWTPPLPAGSSNLGLHPCRSIRFTLPANHRSLPSSPALTQRDSWDILREGESDEEDDQDNVDVPDIKKTYKDRMRKRIRRREAVVTNPEKFRDEINDDLLEENENHLITQEDADIARRSAWVPEGHDLPDLFDIEMGYHKAWDIGRKGCVAAKLNGLWDTQLGPSKNRFFVMDGTDPDCFLNYYTKSDMQAARGVESEKRGTIGAYDMRDGYWDYKRCKVYIQRSDRGGKDTVLTKLSREFMDAMLICIWEMEIRTYLERLKARRLDKRREAKTAAKPKHIPSRRHLQEFRPPVYRHRCA
eukprot:GHVS01042855.1.p1 GENE.GHVS01042855.1~~GHVS01042855.1.p1  ORF type:complete len:315 (+),score=49.99 GHVS01042855.1:261-1205(+)